MWGTSKPKAAPSPTPSRPASAVGSKRPAPVVTPPRQSPSSPPPQSTGTTVGQAVSGRQIYEETKAARATAQEAVNLLEGMAQPGPAESGPLDEVKELLQAICTKLATMDDRLFAIEQRLPARPLRSVL